MTDCKHRDAAKFFVHADMQWLEDSDRFVASFKVVCACGMPFTFVGLPVGVVLEGGAAVDASRQKLTAALKPANEEPASFVGGAGFTLPSRGA